MLLSFLVLSPAFGSTATIHAGFSAAWYNPSRDGAGLVLEVLERDRAVLYWYTYDDEGNPRWLTSMGHIVPGPDGAVIRFETLLAPHGARFGPHFDPEAVEKPDVGEATLRFASCDRGTFHYTAFGQSGTFAVRRLTHTMGSAGCWPYNGVPGKPVKPYAGRSGSWYATAHAGAGFSLQWLSGGKALVTWYTYDTQGHPLWMTGIGHREDGKIVFPSLTTHRGGRFGQPFDPEAVRHAEWGRLTLDLTCTGGVAHYDSKLSAFGSGELALVRLTYLKRPNCPYDKPAFFQLYEVALDEIPIEAGDPRNPVDIRARDIANDGTVVAISNRGPALWHPEPGWWEFLNRDEESRVFIAPDGSRLYASEPRPPGSGDPVAWQPDTGWTRLSGLAFQRSYIRAVSNDLSQVVGFATGPSGDERWPWIWSRSGGQRTLPVTDELPSPVPRAVSNDGDIVVGEGVWVSDQPSPLFPDTYRAWYFAVIWEHGAEPRKLRDDSGIPLGRVVACNRDCSLIFGSGQLKLDPDQPPDQPHLRSSWIWIRGGDTVYFGAPEDGRDPSNSVPTDVTADGDLVVGVYDSRRYDGGGVYVPERNGVYIWTQRTGVVSVDTLLHNLGLWEPGWEEEITPSVSPNGKYILLSGWQRTGRWESPQNRAVVLKLTPREGVPGLTD